MYIKWYCILHIYNIYYIKSKLLNYLSLLGWAKCQYKLQPTFEYNVVLCNGCYSDKLTSTIDNSLYCWIFVTQSWFIIPFAYPNIVIMIFLTHKQARPKIQIFWYKKKLLVQHSSELTISHSPTLPQKQLSKVSP